MKPDPNPFLWLAMMLAVVVSATWGFFFG